MRALSIAASRRQCGITLVELLMGLAIFILLSAVAAPSLSEFNANSRLREAGNTLLSEALFAQSEAIKRNGAVRLSVNGSSVQVIDRSRAPEVVLRDRVLSEGITADAAVDVDFGSTGRLTPLGAVVGNIGVSRGGSTCSDDVRCPALRIESGGSVRLCAKKSVCS